MNRQWVVDVILLQTPSRWRSGYRWQVAGMGPVSWKLKFSVLG